MSQEHRVIAGRYAVIREIGRGGMGVVWLAEDRMIGRRVAIKELHLSDSADARERTVLEERVLREARTAGRLNDPAVVTVYDVLRESGMTFIVMELIEAPTLTDIVDREGPLPPASVARIALQVLSALEAAHAAGVVHRDVKPSNIMVSPTGRAKLTDFGIAQATEDPHLTTTGFLVGSPIYMAPERLRGAEADAGSDLWSLGAVLFFAAEGYDLFEHPSTARIVHAILHETPRLTRCQGPLATVITGLLNTRPEARPSSAEVRRLLAHVATAPQARPAVTTTAPVHPVPPLTRLTPYPAARRRWSVPVTLLAIALVVALLTGGYLVRAVTEPAGDGPGARSAAMDRTLTYGEGGDLKGFSWDAGSDGRCLTEELVPSARITEDDFVECTEPHREEVFDWMVFWEKPDDDCDCHPDISHPGIAELSGYAERLCTMMYDSELISDRTGLRYHAVVPTEQEWAASRTIFCVLYDGDGDQLGQPYVAVE